MQGDLKINPNKLRVVETTRMTGAIHFTAPLAPARKLFCRNGRRRADYRKSEV